MGQKSKCWYRDKICVCDEHPIAGQDMQCQAPDSWSRYTTPFDDCDDCKVMCKNVNKL